MLQAGRGGSRMPLPSEASFCSRWLCVHRESTHWASALSSLGPVPGVMVRTDRSVLRSSQGRGSSSHTLTFKQ